MTIVVVGKNSFLAQNLSEDPVGKNYSYFTHQEIFEQENILKTAEVVINCAYNPLLASEKYSLDHDLDLQLANLIKNSDAHYIMLSSRMAYGPINSPLKESDKCEPNNLYGQAKLETETALRKIFDPQKLIILRLANIFGFETGRQTFFGTALKNLKSRDEISLNIDPLSNRDFLSVWRFSEILAKIVQIKKPGLYNIGMGDKTACGDVAHWLIEGYGKGQLKVSNHSRAGEFWLDMTKTKNAFGLEDYTRDALREDCRRCGQLLAC